MADPGQPASEARTHRTPRWSLLGLLALLLFVTGLGRYTIDHDTVPLVADASGYYRTALFIDRQLHKGHTRHLVQHMLRSRARPPLPQLVTVATFRVLGQANQRTARLSVLAFVWLLLIATYGIGSRLRDPPTGLVAATVLSGFPQVVGYGRCYWMDLPLAAMVAVTIWALVASRGLQRRTPALLLGLCLGLGLLTKYTFPVFVAGPLLLTTLEALRRGRATPLWRRHRRQVLINAALALLVAGVLAAPWYVPTVGAVWTNFVYNQGVGVLHARPVWTVDNLLLYARHLLQIQLGPWWTLASALALVSLGRFGTRQQRWLLLSWIALPYLFFTFLVQGIEWARFTLPYLPALALMLALGLMLPRHHPVLRLLAGGLCCAALATQVVLTLSPPATPGVFPWSRNRNRGLLTPQVFPPLPRIRQLFPGVNHHRWTRVAIAPDMGSLASVLETAAVEQHVLLRVGAPYEPEAPSVGARFTFPDRVDDPRYLRQFHYLVRVVHPVGVDTVVRRPDLYRRFRPVWQRAMARAQLLHQLVLPTGVVLHVLRQATPR